METCLKPFKFSGSRFWRVQRFSESISSGESWKLSLLFCFQSIENNWRDGRYTLQRIDCRSEKSAVGVYCLQYDDHKIVSGLRDNTIKIWDRNSLQCIKVGSSMSPTGLLHTWKNPGLFGRKSRGISDLHLEKSLVLLRTNVSLS